MLQWLHLFQPLEEPVVKPEQRGNQGMHICWTHQQFIHAGLAFFQVYSLYGDTLLSGDTEGRLHHSCGPAAWESWPQHSNDKVDRGEDSTHSTQSIVAPHPDIRLLVLFTHVFMWGIHPHIARASSNTADCLFGSLQIRPCRSCKVVPAEEPSDVTDGWTAVSSR